MKISVITINLNNRAGLQRTLESVLVQSFRDFEHIVIDGASTDGSVELLQQHGEQLKFISEKDKGIYDAMNKGIEKASGEFLLFINSGDYLFEKNTLENAAKFLDASYAIVYGNMKISGNGTLSDGFMPDEINLSQMMNDTLWHPVSFIKKELFMKYGLYDTSYKICGDYDFFFKAIIAKKAVAKHINQFIAVFDLNGMSSDVKNVAIIKAEREKSQRTYLSEAEINEFKKQEQKKKSVNFFTRWFR